MSKEKIVFGIEAGKYLNEVAAELRKMPEFEMPKWAAFVKTSSGRARPPASSDWWAMRAASILRQLYMKNIMGVQRLRTRYGGRKNRGMKPERFHKSSGKIIRTILQQATKAGFAEEVKDSLKKGRKLTKRGREFMEEIAKKLK